MNSELQDAQRENTVMSDDDVAAVQRLQSGYQQLCSELSKVIVGQQQVIEELIIALFCRGHALLVGVPGLAKTLLVSSLAQALGLSFSRIQFTPDLMPSDITGTEVIEEDRATGKRQLRFVRGPIFANLILADEINRTPPKTQAALLEAMQEQQVTAGGQTYTLQRPFFVLATQNPVEQEGTYPLPEAQLDRFMFSIRVDYPSETEEFEIIRLTTERRRASIERILSGQDMDQIAELVRRVPVADHVVRYALALSRLTRRGAAQCPDFVDQYVRWGAGPRASQYLVLAAKARALLKGRSCAQVQDIQAVAPAVLRHRIVTSFNAQADRIDSDQIIARLIDFVSQQQEKMESGDLASAFKTAVKAMK